MSEASPLSVEYLQRELTFWREETMRLRLQVEKLDPVGVPSSTTVPPPKAALDGRDEVAVDPERSMPPTAGAKGPLFPHAFLQHVTSNPEFERQAFRFVKRFAYLAALILFVARILLELPLFLLLPVVGIALVCYSGSFLRL